MRLVKKSVNQDDPGTYHLFYADGAGTPGSDLTFFPWLHIAPGRPGVGETARVSLAVPEGSLGDWQARLAQAGVLVRPLAPRFGDAGLELEDPDGLRLALVESGDDGEFQPWADGPVPPEQQVRRIHAVSIDVRDPEPSALVLTDLLDLDAVGEENGCTRYGQRGAASGTLIDVCAAPDARPARLGRGSVHHVAWRVPDDEAQLRVRQRLLDAGLHPTPVIDRFWFRSVYFHEPGGVLYELATDGPGFSVDEEPERLGQTLILPPWLEPRRGEIQRILPDLDAD